MKLPNETSALLKEEEPLQETKQDETYSIPKIEDIGKSFAEKYGVDPFDGSLCDECKELGYCKYDKQKAEERRAIFLKDDEICNLVPIHYDDEYYRHSGSYSKKHLKAAFEAFHQQDYETSVLNAEVVIDENKTLAAPYLVIAVCQYFLGDYAEAINQYEIYLGNIQYIPQDARDKMHYFIWHCENLINQHNL